MSSDRADLAQQWRSQTAAALTPFAELVAPRTAGVQPAYDELVVLDSYAVRKAAKCPGLLDDFEEFQWKALFARRRISQLVLQQLQEDATRNPLETTRDLIDQMAAHPSDDFENWLAELQPGGRTAVMTAALAVVMATRMLLAQWPPRAKIQDPAASWKWSLPARAVQLRGRCEAIAGSVTSRRDIRNLLVLGLSQPDPEDTKLELAHVALCCTLATGSAPAKVTHLSVHTGQRHRIDVTGELLAQALEAAAQALIAKVRLRHGPPPALHAGPWCSRCARRDSCADRQAWSTGPEFRVGGLLPDRIPAL